MRIAAVVNDDVISIYDLAARINIVVASSNLTDAPELRRQIAPQILRTLVDEYLQIQEASRLDIAVGEKELNFAISQIEKNRGIGKGEFNNYVNSLRLDRDAIIAQIKAEIAWSKVVTRRLNAAISVGEDEIDEALARLESSRGQPENRVAEIFLSIESPEQEREIMKAADNLVAQLRQGAQFAGIARQFSQSATSAVGGDIGWVIAGQLPGVIDGVLPGLEKGEISDIIRTFDGVHIVKLLDRRTVLTADPMNTRLKLAQLIIDDIAADPELMQEKLARAHGESKSCADMLRLSADFVSPQSGDLGELSLGDMPLDLRQAVHQLEAMALSAPLPFANGFRILMVCSRDEAKVDVPSRDAMRQIIGNRRLELQARRYLRDLRRSAFVELRV
ncbi:MAG: peptidyl-prolyl cis-trans isomerase [Rhodospirillaceae bacterium]|nr:peptidyl-prolyl cis-trans isomerase [Rhodospirillaceae bacterium]MBT3926692.1 peptidyl-prolyl cis-trans isomerase [Rhodospirillaceae bacterium]MBT4426532.1 peptidyl-prolyl cis-trans isomerase [Rhodospirillaceae bacterium]MBT5677422.1 peptidyl-prolyl cis-trans isomerase [Rhodospirillaceae bacterium]MBT6830675.1 peptidyl-prolyl cis-trans isomerase [Rhodospirillaceae bacterium]